MLSRALVGFFFESGWSKVEGLRPYISRVSRFFQQGTLKYRWKQRNPFEPTFGQILAAGAGFLGVRKWPSTAVQIDTRIVWASPWGLVGSAGTARGCEGSLLGPPGGSGGGFLGPPGGLLGASWGLLGPSGASWGLLGPPGLCCGLLGSAGASWGLLGPPGAFWGLLGISWGLLGPPGASWGILGLLVPTLAWCLLWPSGACWVSWGLLGLPGASWVFPGPLGSCHQS